MGRSRLSYCNLLSPCKRLETGTAAAESGIWGKDIPVSSVQLMLYVSCSVNIRPLQSRPNINHLCVRFLINTLVWPEATVISYLYRDIILTFLVHWDVAGYITKVQ